jgi:release factor glutamine methyltransferase
MIYDPSQVYRPEADTCLLLEAALAEVKPGDRVLEVGTGSGLIACEIAKIVPVVATDINPHAAVSARNCGVEVIRTDLFAGICGMFDVVLFNPPYLPTLPEEKIDDWLEYALDGGESGRVVIERFAVEVNRILSPCGRILLLVSSLTDPDEVRDFFSQQGFSSAIAVREIVEDEELIVLRIIRAR